ncbi:hypothetical protein HanRHA438_Chr09g0381841 [Helianthus annuus]|nr:hypothetical protein HanRHA438_Chr09g0381841 [Helianthus annuus]
MLLVVISRTKNNILVVDLGKTFFYFVSTLLLLLYCVQMYFICVDPLFNLHIWPFGRSF